MSDLSDPFRVPAAADFNHQSPDVVVAQQLAIRIFANASDEVMIVQCADWCDEENSRIAIAEVHAEAVAQAILNAAALIRGEAAKTVTRNGVAGTVTGNADRQRRYRERKKNGPETVTGDGTRHSKANDTQSVTRNASTEQSTSLFAAPAREQRNG